MNAYLWRVIAKRNINGGRIPAGTWVEIMLTGTSRKPNQREIIDALNSKFPGIASSGLTILGNFDIIRVN